MISKNTRRLRRSYRHKRIRKKITGTGEIPRVTVFKSSKHIYAQVIDDTAQITLCGVSTQTPEVREQFEKNNEIKNIEKSSIVGKKLGELLKERGISEIKFDRSGYPYHGRVKALADGIREAGINF